MSGYVFPTSTYDATNVVLLEIPKADIPFFRRQWEIMQARNTWYDRESWFRGYQEAAWLEEKLMTNTLAGVAEAIDRVYRLLDTTLNGAAYTASTDPATSITTVTPTIPAVPPVEVIYPEAMRAQIYRLYQLAENAHTGAEFDAGSAIAATVGLDYNGSWRARLEAVQGVINAGWFGIGGEPAKLADVVNALRVGSEDQKASILDALQNILSAGANAATIFGIVEDLFSDTVNATGEGAILGTLIASSIANAAMMGAVAGQIDRLVAALDGGGLVAAVPAPAGSVTGELEAIKVQVQ
jgi:hypothetical protein